MLILLLFSSNPAKAVQVAITVHRLFQSAKAAGHTNLAIHSAKKLLDYHVFCLLAGLLFDIL